MQFPHSLYKGAFCVGFLCLYLPVSLGEKVIPGCERELFPSCIPEGVDSSDINLSFRCENSSGHPCATRLSVAGLCAYSPIVLHIVHIGEQHSSQRCAPRAGRTVPHTGRKDCSTHGSRDGTLTTREQGWHINHTGAGGGLNPPWGAGGGLNPPWGAGRTVTHTREQEGGDCYTHTGAGRAYTHHGEQEGHIPTMGSRKETINTHGSRKETINTHGSREEV